MNPERRTVRLLAYDVSLRVRSAFRPPGRLASDRRDVGDRAAPRPLRGQLPVPDLTQDLAFVKPERRRRDVGGDGLGSALEILKVQEDVAWLAKDVGLEEKVQLGLVECQLNPFVADPTNMICLCH